MTNPEATIEQQNQMDAFNAQLWSGVVTQKHTVDCPNKVPSRLASQPECECQREN